MIRKKLFGKTRMASLKSKKLKKRKLLGLANLPSGLAEYLPHIPSAQR